MKFEVVCINEREHDSGQRVKLVIPLPASKPVEDGSRRPVAHPPPPSAFLELFVTSEERQAILYQIDPLERQAKAIRPESAVDDHHKKELLTEKARLGSEVAALKRKLQGLTSELKFAHAGRYLVTIEPMKGAK